MPSRSRRQFLSRAAVAGAGAVVASTPIRAAGKDEDQVSPNEDLMREHGVLVRCLVIYREIMRRLQTDQDYPPAVVSGTARLIRAFVEDYHEKLEEDQLFPRFRKAGKLVDLVDVLNLQHQKGRVVTDRIVQIAASAHRSPDDRKSLLSYLDMFVRMYEPHEAREDTVLFPAFRTIVSPHEYDALGEDFEKKENQLFGSGGFEKNVAAVAELEKKLGINDLRKFTPAV